jgi:DNA-binding CsgD family transcriptional regulator/tetratricopeptide (TPR) repeat protein
VSIDPGSELKAAHEALASGDWEGARDGFQSALAGQATPDAHDGLGRALWWLGDLDGAIDHRERAYAGFRKIGDTGAAARIALWLAREYLEAVGNEPASNGWVARAEGLLSQGPRSIEHGWLALTLADRALDPVQVHTHANVALDLARRHSEPDLEASALAMVGRASILDGDVDGGMKELDEAMTAATSGEVADPLVFGDICCVVTKACEEAGELDRLMRWNDVIQSFLERNHHAPLLQFCGTCGAEAFLARGDLATAEACLTEAIRGLEHTGHRSRCIPPNVKLAELRVLQGRVEEAERLLAGHEDLPEAIRATVAIHRMKGEHAIAAALLLRRLNQVGDTLLAVPLLSLLVEVQIEHGAVAEAAASSDRLSAFATSAGNPRAQATASLAIGRVMLVRGDGSAPTHLEAALETFTRVGLPLEAARTRLELARAHRQVAPALAGRDARIALDAFEKMGATHEVDAAAALIREVGGPARTGQKGVGLLTPRETEVLWLLGEGLSNAEIAARLYISTKTAGNHVSNILAKLHLRSRQKAAGYAVRLADPASL